MKTTRFRTTLALISALVFATTTIPSISAAPAENVSYETRVPVTAIRDPETSQLVTLFLRSTGRAESLWFSFTPQADGFVHLTQEGSSAPGREFIGIYEGEPNGRPSFVSARPIPVVRNIEYAIRYRSRHFAAADGESERFLTYFSGSPRSFIADENLAEAVRSSYALDPGTSVPASLLASLKSLFIRGDVECDDGNCHPAMPVASLHGIQGATSLESIHLKGGRKKGQGHRVSDLSPIAGLTSLTTLRLPNALKGTSDELLASTTTAAQLPHLTHLSLEQNALEDRHISPLASLTTLETLDIDKNQISDISPLAPLTNLDELDIDENPITDLGPLSKMQRLRDLDISDIPHGIRSLPPLRGLRRLTISSRELAPLARSTDLTRLDLGQKNEFRPSRTSDLTPLANQLDLGTIRNFSGSATTSLAPFSARITTINPPLLRSLLSGSAIDLTSPTSQAILSQRAAAGIPFDLTGIITYPFDANAPIPDGRLRSALPNANAGRVQAILVTSLKGIQPFTALTSISATDGLITDLTPLASLPALRFLDLRNNEISDVGPIANHEFDLLDLTGNPLDYTTIPEAWLTDPAISLDPPTPFEPSATVPDAALRTAIRATLGMGARTPITPAALATLTSLHVEGLKIRSLVGLENATNLRGASLRNNVIHDFSPVADLPQLRWLRIAGNPGAPGFIAPQDRTYTVDNDETARFDSTISAVGNTVFAEGYQLTSLAFLSLFPEVETLYLSDNFINDISVLEELSALRTVHLSGNYLTSSAQPAIDQLESRGVTVITEDQRPGATAEFPIEGADVRSSLADALNLAAVPPAFTGEQLDLVTQLDLNNEVFDDQDPFISVSASDLATLGSLTNLEFLKIERGGIAQINFLADLTKLRRLDIDFNEITDLSPLTGLTQLTELDLNDNAITNLSPLSAMTQLDSLDLDDNQISDITPLSTLTNLTDLDLSANTISDITTLTALPNLQTVDLRSNQIDYRDPEQLAALTTLRQRGVGIIVDPDTLTPPALEFERTTNGLSLHWEPEAFTTYELLSTTDFRSFDSHGGISTGKDPRPIGWGFSTRLNPRRFYQLRIAPSEGFPPVR